MVAFAKVDDKLKKKDMKEQKEIVQMIANGSDTLVGAGVKLHGYTESINDGDITTQWASGGWNHTHQFIAARGITILENDKGSSIAQHLYELDGTSIIMEYADKPDVDEIGFPLFVGHFYDGVYHNNYMGNTSPTAKTNFTSHMASAVNNFNSNKTYAWQELGRAIHYISDLNEAHHASNNTVLNSNHSDYEEWVDINRVTYGATISFRYNDYPLDTFASYVNKIADDSADHAYSYRTPALASDTTHWNTATSNTLPRAQEQVAALLYRFLKEVGEI